MRRLGASHPALLAGLGILGVAGATVLQVSTGLGMTVGETLRLVVESIIGLAIPFLFLRIEAERKERERVVKAEEKERERALLAERKEREDTAARGEAGREKLHIRLNEMLDSLAKSAFAEGQRYGQLLERVDGVKEDIEGFGFKLEGWGSKVTNTAEKAWETRSAEFLRRLERVEKITDGQS